MATIRRFEEIQAWQKGRELAREIYKTCKSGPLERDFGLKHQMCRAAVSAMSNVAEGFSRKGDKEFGHFLDIARGSATEVESLLYVALDNEYISQIEFKRLFKIAEETVSLIGGFTTYLRQKSL